MRDEAAVNGGSAAGPLRERCAIVVQARSSAELGAAEFSDTFHKVEEEVGRVIVGMRPIIRLSLATFFAGGHVLLEGQPGLAKTRLAESIAEAVGLDFGRIQFTPDLMPGDITGSLVLSENGSGHREFRFRQGSVFHNIILADEINRAGPKTQSALLEAMQNGRVSVDGKSHLLPQPFTVLATENPIEEDGTYPLPKAEMDRFMVKLIVHPPSQEELGQILRMTTGTTEPKVVPVFSNERAAKCVLAMREQVRSVVISPQIEDFVLKLVTSLDPNHPERIRTDVVTDNVTFGPSPRGAQSMVLLAKTYALMNGRYEVLFDDIKEVGLSPLRHRLILKLESAFEVDPDSIIVDVWNQVYSSSPLSAKR